MNQNFNDEPNKKEMVLIVDDNDGDRKLMSLALTQDGYRVMEARDGKEALQIFKDYLGKIDLILTDILMPEMDGVELIQCIRKLVPRLPVIFISSYKRKWEEMMDDNRGTAFIEKSYDLSSLLSKVHEVLDKNKNLLIDWLKSLVPSSENAECLS